MVTLSILFLLMMTLPFSPYILFKKQNKDIPVESVPASECDAPKGQQVAADSRLEQQFFSFYSCYATKSSKRKQQLHRCSGRKTAFTQFEWKEQKKKTELL